MRDPAQVRAQCLMSRGCAESSAWNELRTACTCAGESRPEGSTSAGAAGDEDDAEEGEGVLGTATVRGATEDAAVVAAAGTVAQHSSASASASSSGTAIRSRMTLGRSRGSARCGTGTCCDDKGCTAAFVELTVDAEAVGEQRLKIRQQRMG